MVAAEKGEFLRTVFWARFFSHRGEGVLSGFAPVTQKCCPFSGLCFLASLFLDPEFGPFLGPPLVDSFRSQYCGRIPALAWRQCRKWMELPVGMPSLDDVLANSLCALIGHWSAASVLIRFSVWWIGFGVLRRWEGAQRAELRVFKR